MSRHYFDCPNCGKSYWVEQLDHSQEVQCDGRRCGHSFRVGSSLNIRTTPERINKSGFFDRIFGGTTIQFSEREKAINLIESRIRKCEWLHGKALRDNDFAQAQYWKNRHAELLEELDDL
jgi:hypothetical protein